MSGFVPGGLRFGNYGNGLNAGPRYLNLNNAGSNTDTNIGASLILSISTTNAVHSPTPLAHETVLTHGYPEDKGKQIRYRA